jgi:hypothetical protein
MLGLVEVPGEARRSHGSGHEGRHKGHHYGPFGTVSGPPQLVPAEKLAAQAPQGAAFPAG